MALIWFGVADQSNPSSSVEPKGSGIALYVSALSRKTDAGPACGWRAPVMSIWRSRFSNAGQVRVVKSTERAGICGTLSSVSMRCEGWAQSRAAVSVKSDAEWLWPSPEASVDLQRAGSSVVASARAARPLRSSSEGLAWWREPCQRYADSCSGSACVPCDVEQLVRCCMKRLILCDDDAVRGVE